MKCCYNSHNCPARPLNCDKKDFILWADADTYGRGNERWFILTSCFIPWKRRETNYLMERFHTKIVVAPDAWETSELLSGAFPLSSRFRGLKWRRWGSMIPRRLTLTPFLISLQVWIHEGRELLGCARHANSFYSFKIDFFWLYNEHEPEQQTM